MKEIARAGVLRRAARITVIKSPAIKGMLQDCSTSIGNSRIYPSPCQCRSNIAAAAASHIDVDDGHLFVFVDLYASFSAYLCVPNEENWTRQNCPLSVGFSGEHRILAT